MISFTKMHCLGNDYVFVDCTNNKNFISNPAVFSKNISNRNFGIGSDGLILIENSKVADFKMRVFNSDGSEAELSGNAISCAGKYVFDNKLINKTSIKIETLAGIKKLELKLKNNKVYMTTLCLENFKIFDKFELNILDKKFNMNPISIGNPHAVIFVNNLNDIDINKYAPIIENHKVFSNKTNVEFAQIINSNRIKVKIWERGCGITLCCSTGACACSITAYNKKLIYKNPIVELPGGNLQTYIDEKNKCVYTSIPVTTVYGGIYFN